MADLSSLTGCNISMDSIVNVLTALNNEVGSITSNRAINSATNSYGVFYATTGKRTGTPTSATTITNSSTRSAVVSRTTSAIIDVITTHNSLINVGLEVSSDNISWFVAEQQTIENLTGGDLRTAYTIAPVLNNFTLAPSVSATQYWRGFVDVISVGAGVSWIGDKITYAIHSTTI